MTARQENTINASNSLKPNVSALVEHRPSYQPMHHQRSEPKEYSGSKACDPITILDDDEPDAAEIGYIDLENGSDNKAAIKGNYADTTQQAVAGTQVLGFQSVAKSHNPEDKTQGPYPARYTEGVTHPLFRALTKDDFLASSVQPLPENRGIGFKAWYRGQDSYRTANTAPVMQQKAVSRNPSITLFNEERTQNTTKRDRDAPQFDMSVLSSKRKRTIGELGYNELISPTQIESPLEKLARMAKKRRQCQEKCDTEAGNAQTAMDFHPAYGHESNKIIGENVELASPPCVHKSLDEDVLTAQRQEDRGDGYKNTSATRTRQTITQNSDAHEYSEGIRAADSRDNTFVRHKLRHSKPRIGGPTNVCGIFSPEKKPPAKRSNRGAFHCPRCDSQFTTPQGVNYHFEKCINKHGNPRSLKWNDHPSLGAVGKLSMIVLSPALKIQTSSLSRLPEKQSITEEQALSSANESKLDCRTSLVEHRETGGKGLSAETLKRFREAGNWDVDMVVDQRADEAQDEETEVPNIAYQYFVRKREWLETEEDAVESSMGPYYTLNEANAIAKAEVQSPQIDGFEGVQSKGWSYFYKQDEHGMQTHMATVLEVNIEVVVHRELAPPNQQAAIPKSAFILAPRVYIVHELQWLPNPPDKTNTVPSHCQSLTHGVFTLLNQANQRASAEYLETLTGNWGNSEYDLLKKAEAKSDLGKKVRALNREDDLFREEITLGNEGFAKVWVELVVVEGPRN